MKTKRKKVVNNNSAATNTFCPTMALAFPTASQQCLTKNHHNPQSTLKPFLG
jgi:hypothetical protein